MGKPTKLFLDIETLPGTVLAWGIYKQHALEVVQHPIIAGYSAKWEGGEHITRTLYDLPFYDPAKPNDTQLISELWNLLDKADIVVAHYGDGFDLPFIRARFTALKLHPPSPWKSIDTKKIAAKLFHFGGAYTLDHIAQYLGVGKKLPTGGFELWSQCMKGNPMAWAKMRRYNKHDVVVLQKVYERMLPWIPDHPNYSLYMGERSCPKCGSSKLQQRGTAKSVTRTYVRFQCQKCGGWSRSVKSEGRTLVTNAS